MNDSEIRRRIENLRVADPGAEDRAVLALGKSVPVPRADAQKHVRSGVIATAAMAVILAFSPVGSAIGDAAEDLFSGYPDPKTAAQEEHFQEQSELFETQLRGVRLKAAAGDLEADVSGERVRRVISKMLDPSSGSSDRFEARSIRIVEQLRASGDLPKLGTPHP